MTLILDVFQYASGIGQGKSLAFGTKLLAKNCLQEEKLITRKKRMRYKTSPVHHQYSNLLGPLVWFHLTDDDTYIYNYDCENRLMEVSYGGSAIAKYYYDYAGRRIAKVANGVTATYHYDGPQVIAEYEYGTLKRKFIYGPGD